VDAGKEHVDKELVIESQGFEEYPSKSSATENLADNQPTNKSTQQIANAQQPEYQQAPSAQEQTNQTSTAPAPDYHKVILPSLSVQLNEGHFYDEKQYHDEDDSMAEYGLGENDQFNDEGSFIGLYNRDRIQNYMAQFNKNNLN